MVSAISVCAHLLQGVASRHHFGFRDDHKPKRFGTTTVDFTVQFRHLSHLIISHTCICRSISEEVFEQTVINCMTLLYIISALGSIISFFFLKSFFRATIFYCTFFNVYMF